jgi:acetolactate synthase I/II/III large subunit
MADVNAASIVMSTLAEAGVEKVFGVIGTSTMDVADAMFQDGRIEFVSARTEEAAAHMADGYARASGRVGVVLCHVGPGALRQLYGVGTAFKDSVPMLVLTGNEVLRATDTAMRESYHVIDVLDLYRPVTKATLQLRDGNDAGALVARGLWLAGSGRPGPVLVDLPKSALKQPFTGRPARLGLTTDRVPLAPISPDAGVVVRVAELIAGARAPMVFVGGGIHWSGGAEALRILAEHRNLPVLTTDGGRGAIPDDHPNSLGVIGRQAGDAVALRLMAEADVIVGIGTPFSDISTLEWSSWSDDARIVQVDISPDVSHRSASVDVQVLSDAKAFLEVLEHQLDALGFRWPGDLSEDRARLAAERAGYLSLSGQAGGDGMVNPWVLIDELDRSLPRDAFISVDVGMHSFYGKKLRVYEPRTYIRSAGFGAMGYAFPALLGALEAAEPGRRAAAVIGDGCLAMTLGEFETAARRGTNLTLVVFNDSRFASQQSHQRRRLGGRIIGTDFAPTDFAAIAEAQGVKGFIARTDAEARDAVRAALAHDGPSIVDARLDRTVQPATWIEGSGDTRLVDQKAAALKA